MLVFHEQHDTIDACVDIIQIKAKTNVISVDNTAYTFKTTEELRDILELLITTMKKDEAGVLLVVFPDNPTCTLCVEHWWRADAEESGVDIFTVG